MRSSDFIILAASLLASSFLASSHALAGDGETLAKKNSCMMCHAMAGKSAGPSFEDIAAKYRLDKNAQAALEKKVRSGGKDAWGSMPMPATARSVSDDDIKSMVQWILSLK